MARPDGRPLLRRKRGWIRLVLGTVLLVGGGGAAVKGVVDTLAGNEAARDEAVVEGEVRGVGLTEPHTFAVPDGGGDFTIYLVAGGGNDEDREREVTSTVCEVSFSDGTATTLDGSRQGTSTTVGDLRTVGTFTAPAGSTRLACGWRPPSPYLDRGRRAADDYLVSPGRPSAAAASIGLIMGGVLVALAGGALVVSGAIGRRVRA